MPKRSQQATRDTRTDILKRALDLASIDGLSGVTIGRLSDSISMSKSGLFAHFGSKEDLQMAIVDAAAEAFEKAVVGEERAHAGGLPRLVEVAEAWIRYLEKGPFRGGCFFAAVSPEIDDRPGRVRDRVVELTRGWLAILEAEAEAAREAGDLGPDADPSQLAFEIHAFVQEANWAFQLHGDAEAFRRARRAVRRTLHSAGATTD
ncbi:MAG TPA: TetR/AcrR family transcriptional regulator [Candidatus Limnocylindrales bacterium]|nr:TetR/AcrR family transcriptional regulator [Candidatus Limnocylindrales bacterium]